MLLRNDLSPQRQSLSLALTGSRGNRDGLGTGVVTASGVRQQAWRRGGSGFCSQSDPHLLFGLGQQDRVEKVELFWPNGATQTLRDLRADQVVAVREP